MTAILVDVLRVVDRRRNRRAARHVGAVLAVGLAGCIIAPPLGIGRGATTTAGDSGSASSIAIGAGIGEHRAITQVDGAITFRRSERFSVDVGGTVNQLLDRRSGMFTFGWFPYIRPRWTFGGASIAIAGSAAAFGAGEGGMLMGFTDVQLGYGGSRWSIYAGAYGSGCLVADGGPIVVAAQVRAGAEVWVVPGADRLGVAVEVFRQADSIDLDGEGPAHRSDLVGVALKLRSEW